MSGGRPGFGVDHVDSVQATDEEKRRRKAILRTRSGELPVNEACRELGIGESRFHELRKEVLQAAVGGLLPKPPGRPPKEDPEESTKVRRLTRRVEDLEAELRLSWIRSEIAAILPDHLRRPEWMLPEKKGSSPKRKGKRRRR